jgi:hypothetical protein
MIFLSWISIVEGGSDRSYLDILLPRVMDDIAFRHGRQTITVPPAPVAPLGLTGREIEAVAEEACKLKDAAHIVFVHADTGGRGLAGGLAARSCAYCDAMHAVCGWQRERCVVVAPRHETEAWALADPLAVTNALGYAGKPNALGLPPNAAAAERLGDPKATLDAAFRLVRRRSTPKRAGQVLPLIAQSQSIDALRGAESFQAFEAMLAGAMRSLGCID